ncbi:Glyoxalase family protein [Minicystis rosea]|nr:Glyoxalase family protein [Minicystis rosea]
MRQHAIHWFEIFVRDLDRAVRFYETVLDIELRRATEDGRPMALFASAVEDGIGGALVHQRGREPTESGALVYLDADGKLDESLARVEGAGGRVIMPKTDIGPPGFVALVHDTEGNLVGFHSRRAPGTKLHVAGGSCSLAANIALEEAGMSFALQRVDLRAGEHRGPAYLKLNPKGKVPVLELEDGTVLTENPAIISYIADTHSQASLLPSPGDRQRAVAQEWLAWCASTIHPSFALLFEALFRGAQPDDALKAATQSHLDRFDRALEGKRFVLGDRFSAADAYTLVFVCWIQRFGLGLGENTRRSAKALLERPGVRRAVRAHGIAIEV